MYTFIVNQNTHEMIWLCGTQHSGSFEQTGLCLDRLKGSTLDFPVPVVFNNVNFKTTVQMLLIIYSLDLMSKVKHCSTIEARFTKNVSWPHVQSVKTSA